jgi:hypothetical protein
MMSLDRTHPLARGLLCAACMDGPGPAAANLIYPHLLTGATAPGGLATEITAPHQDWYNRLGSGYSFCLWHDGITLSQAWDIIIVVSDGVMSLQRYGSNNCLRVYHNGTGYTLPNVLLDDIAAPGLLTCVWTTPTLRVYVNDQQIESVVCYLAPKTDSATSTLILGGSTVLGRFLVYDRALSADEVGRLHRQPSALFDRLRRWPPVVAPAGTVHELAGSARAVSSVSGTLSVRSPEPADVPASEDRRPWRRAVLCNGVCADAFHLGTVLTRGWFWTRHAGCTAVYCGPTVEKVDFRQIVHVADMDARQITLPAHLTPEAGAKCCSVIRRFNGHGDEEHTRGAAVVVRMGHDGRPAPPAPNDVFALHSVQVAGGRVRLEWLYCPLDQQAELVRFNIYKDNAGGPVDFDTPLATVAYQGRRFHRCLTDALPDGTHRFVVRAESADGVESEPGPMVSCSVRTTGPESVTILAAEAIL